MLQKVEILMEEHIKSIGDLRCLELYKKVPKGKRLRAKLILKIAGETTESINLAAVIELIHAASLLHDDVIDEAATRRGVTSINHDFGNITAIMLGDVLYSKGFSKLTDLPNEVAQYVANAVTKLSIGELLDVEIAKDFNTDIDKYFDMIYKKTASLIEASAYCAAYISNKDTTKFETYGRNLGLAFQIIDDVLDITQDSEKLGKPALNDFKEGKTTLPYIYLYNKLEEEDKNNLIKLFGKKLNKKEKNWIKNQMQETNAINDSIKYAQKLGLDALEGIKGENMEDLESIIKDMIIREF